MLDLEAQEKYYLKIIVRYLTWCTDAGEAGELLRRFALFKYGNENPPLDDAGDEAKKSNPDDPKSKGKAIDTGKEADKAEDEREASDKEKIRALSDVITALRKLREGIVATKRTDDFAIQVYLFCIRTTILAGHPESYHPAILHLLRYISLRQPLTKFETEETVTFLILDAACRRRDLTEAFSLRQEFKIKNYRLDLTLQALVHDNFTLFYKVKSVVERYQIKLMEWAEDDMRMHMLKCYGRTYLSVDLEFLERTTGRSWAELKEKDGVGWELDEERVTIRRVRAR